VEVGRPPHPGFLASDLSHGAIPAAAAHLLDPQCNDDDIGAHHHTREMRRTTTIFLGDMAKGGLSGYVWASKVDVGEKNMSFLVESRSKL
jgi:hypothetical protein